MTRGYGAPRSTRTRSDRLAHVGDSSQQLAANPTADGIVVGAVSARWQIHLSAIAC